MGTKIDVVVAYTPIKVIIDEEEMSLEQKMKMINSMVTKALESAEKN